MKIRYNNASFLLALTLLFANISDASQALGSALSQLSVQLRVITEKIDPYYRRWQRDPLAIESLQKFLSKKNKFKLP